MNNTVFKINVYRNPKGKFNNSVKGQLSFVFSFEKNTFSQGKLIFEAGSTFQIPTSSNVKTSKKLNDKTTIKDGIRTLKYDHKVEADNLTQVLNTVFSQNTSKSLKFDTDIDGVKVSVAFIQALFESNRQKAQNKLIDISLDEIETKGETFLISPESFRSFENLRDILSFKPIEIKITQIRKDQKQKFEEKYSINVLNSILISYLTIGDSFRKAEVSAGLEEQIVRNGGGFTAKKIINNYWGASAEDKGKYIGYSRQWLLNFFEPTSDSVSVRLLKNTSSNNLLGYVSDTYIGGEFAATTGYVSLPLLSNFILQKSANIDKFSLGIGQYNDIKGIVGAYSNSIHFLTNDPITYPEYSIINEQTKIKKELNNEKYSIFTTEERMLHAKSYLYNNELIVGSSNFTYSGSQKGNFELSLTTSDSKVIKEYEGWFKEAKGNSVNIKQDIISVLDGSSKPAPSDILLAKVIKNLIPKTETSERSEIVNYKETSPVFDKLYEFQKQAFDSILEGLENNNIFLLADEVGLGKTPVAMAVMDFYKQTRAYDTVVMGPKAVVNGVWAPMQKHKDKVFGETWVFKEISISELSKENEKVQITDDQLNKYKFMIIDESHYFRNSNNLKTANFRKLVAKAVDNGTKILLLSATPIFNEYNDLFNQLNLGKKADNADYIKTFFKEMDKKQGNSKEIFENKKVFDWIKNRFLSRSKDYVKGNFKYDKKMGLPEIKWKQFRSKESEVHIKIFALLDELVEGKAAPIIKFMLAKRLEESVAAFRNSLISMSKGDSEGFINETAFFSEISDDTKFDEDFNVKDIQGSNYKFNSTILNKIMDEVEGQSIEDESKFKELLSKIGSKYSEGAAIFTTSVTTAKELYKSLCANLPNAKIGVMSGKLLETNSSISHLIKTPEDVAALFSPDNMNAQIKESFKRSDEYGTIDDHKLDILIMTDKFAEGINLQQNKRLFNYDTPWSPMIVQQRIGRLNRVNSKYSTIEIINLWPAPLVEKKTQAYARMLRKHGIASTIQDLPNFLGVEVEANASKFVDPLENKVEDENALQDKLIIRDEKLIAQSEIHPGWYTSIKGDKKDLYNLFEVEGEYYLYSGVDKIDTNSYTNLQKLNVLLSEKDREVTEAEHNMYKETSLYNLVYTKLLAKQIEKLNKKVGSKNAKLVATVFVIEREEDW